MSQPNVFKVAQVHDAETLIINKGANEGIKEGQRFLIYAYGDEVIDPDTKSSLGRLEIVKGTGRVTHVQDSISTIKSDMKVSPSKSIRKVRRKNTSPFASFISSMGNLDFEEEVEESLPPKTVPFENPAVGDLAKRV